MKIILDVFNELHFVLTDEFLVEYAINENNSIFYYKTTLMYINDIYTNNTFTISPTFSLSFTYNEMYSQNGYGWYGDTINTKLSDKVSYDNPNAIFYDIWYNNQ